MTTKYPRSLPRSIVESWEQLASDPTALGGLRESRRLHRLIAEWQSVLVREAVAEGASWEQIGEALGSTRQAAWARFRRVVESAATAPPGGERAELHKRIGQLRRTGQARLRELDARWREEQSRLRDQLRDDQRQLREAAGRHASEKAAVREELQRSLDDAGVEAAREQPRPTKRPSTDPR